MSVSAEPTRQTQALPEADQGAQDGYLLVSDVDDTLLGDDAALDRFVEWYERRRPRLEIVYASGRFAPSIAESIRDSRLPEPVALIGGVGSEIRDFDTRELLPGWRESMSSAWDAARLRAVLAREPDLQLQPERFLSDYKVSYYLHEALLPHLEGLLARLRAAGLDADYIYSSQRDLDFLPPGVNKGTAARFYATARGYDADRVFVSGNSGNDASLFGHGFRGIIVGNAHEDLKRLASDRNYLAKQTHAAGVLEGLQHWLRRDGQEA